jgi:DNA-binding MarR family transcriptional regulator
MFRKYRIYDGIVFCWNYFVAILVYFEGLNTPPFSKSSHRMQNAIPFLRELLPELESYLAYEPGIPSLAAFGGYLSRHHAPPTPLTNPGQSLEGRISQYIAELYKYARFHMRPTLERYGLQNLDEFGILITTAYQPGITKTTLYKDQLLEYSTGNEMVKRLMDRGLIRQEPHPEDKRAKALFCTPEGEQLLQALMPQLDADAQTIAGDLTPPQKEELHRTLAQLEHFHRTHFG